jgi:hypothetical protein
MSGYSMDTRIGEDMHAILEHVDVEERDDFLAYVLTAKAGQEFLARLDADRDLREAVKAAAKIVSMSIAPLIQQRKDRDAAKAAVVHG